MSGDPVGDEESASSLNGNTNVKAAAMDTRDFYSNATLKDGWGGDARRNEQRA